MNKWYLVLGFVFLLPFSVLAQDNMDLYIAANDGDLSKVRELTQQGYDVNVICPTICSGWTPVMIASANGHFEIVKFLLEHGANPNAQNRFGRTPIMFATRYHNKRIIEILLQYGADPTITSQDDETPNSAMADALIMSIQDPDAYEILKMLVQKTGNVRFSFWDFTPLLLAVRNDDYDFAKYLLDHGADPYQVKTVQQNGKAVTYDLNSLAQSEKMRNLIQAYQTKN